jgi:hypothetical protein
MQLQILLLFPAIAHCVLATMTTALTKTHVETIFSHLTSGNSTAFFENVNDNVDWLVTGDSHPLARRWNSKEEFLRGSWDRVGAIMQEPMQLSVVNTLVVPEGGGLSGTAVVELRGVGGVLKNGKCCSNEYLIGK